MTTAPFSDSSSPPAKIQALYMMKKTTGRKKAPGVSNTHSYTTRRFPALHTRRRRRSVNGLGLRCVTWATEASTFHLQTVTHSERKQELVSKLYGNDGKKANAARCVENSE